MKNINSQQEPTEGNSQLDSDQPAFETIVTIHKEKKIIRDELRDSAVLEIPSDLDRVADETAKIIGGAVTPERVKALMQATNQGRHIIHGIKENKDFPRVRNEGILPLTPEGGSSSFWTSGTRMFLAPKGKNFTSYDTGFLHYGHSYHTDRSKTFMTLALTNAQILNDTESSAEIKDNCYIQLHREIPRDKICILRVEIDKDISSSTDPRIYGQIAEQHMFDLLEDCLKNGYEPGTEKVVKVSMSKELPKAA